MDLLGLLRGDPDSGRAGVVLEICVHRKGTEVLECFATVWLAYVAHVCRCELVVFVLWPTHTLSPRVARCVSVVRVRAWGWGREGRAGVWGRGFWGPGAWSGLSAH